MEDFVKKLATFRHDPLGYVEWTYPWGKPGPLMDQTLRVWQRQALDDIGQAARAGRFPYYFARGTGHGVGKSALAAMLVDWAFNTCVDTKILVTANTENQLRTKTWVEIGKWRRMSRCAPLSDFRATSMVSSDPFYEFTWRADMIPWSEHNTDAFAGLHNKGRRILLLMDEASGIDDKIWEVAEGALIDDDTEILWVVFGNPTRPRGRFRDVLPGGKFAHRWNTGTIDARAVEGTNKRVIQTWLEDYGEDSDFFRARVRGIPPRGELEGFIPYDVAATAASRPLPDKTTGPLVFGLDVAREGGDAAVLYRRMGMHGRLPVTVWRGEKLTTLATEVASLIVQEKPLAIFIDETGLGVGVVDFLRSYNLPTVVHGINFSSAPLGLTLISPHNRRAEMWALMRQWLIDGGCIHDRLPGTEHTFPEELTAVRSGFAEKVTGRSDTIKLESKRDIYRRTRFSTDFGDALALTFAIPLPLLMPVDVIEPARVESYNPLKRLYDGRSSTAAPAASYSNVPASFYSR